MIKASKKFIRCTFRMYMLPKAPSPPLLSLRLSASSLPHTQVEKIRQPSHCSIDALCAAAICLPNLQRKPRSTGSSTKRWWPRPRREVSSLYKAADGLFFTSTASKALCLTTSGLHRFTAAVKIAFLKLVRSQLLSVRLHCAACRTEGCSEEEEAAGGSL